MDDFSSWLWGHYESPGKGGKFLICLRCGEEVGYVTKHAALRHGDDIEVMPSVPTATKELVEKF